MGWQARRGPRGLQEQRELPDRPALQELRERKAREDLQVRRGLQEKMHMIVLYPSVTDITGNISENGYTQITLTAGYYLVSYSVSGVLRNAGYVQVTPYYNGATHLETGVYFATSANGSSAAGSAHFILEAADDTTFSLTYSGPTQVINGAATITFLKLNRPV